VGRISPDYYCIDGSIPRAALGRVLSRIEELSARYGLRCANVFHAGDGNLHPLILYDANIAGELETTEKFASDILELCIEVGGTITGEHGVGVEKDQPDVRAVRAGRARAIPRGEGRRSIRTGCSIPGKAVPTLHRCAEFGKMHVHRGAVAHPDLPRF
jgi:glycolate oxidase